MTEELGAPGSLQIAARMAAAALLLTAAALAFGFLAGAWAAGRAAARKRREGRTAAADNGRRRRDELCECGVMLPKSCTPEEKLRHQASNRHKSNMLKLGNASKVIVCEEVSEYRAAAVALVKPDDHVLEVGCHVGGTTKVLAGLCKKLVGVDQQADLVAQARIRLPDVQFEILDAFDASKVLALQRQIAPERFKKVFIDISGSRDISTVVRLMDLGGAWGLAPPPASRGASQSPAPTSDQSGDPSIGGAHIGHTPLWGGGLQFSAAGPEGGSCRGLQHGGP